MAYGSENQIKSELGQWDHKNPYDASQRTIESFLKTLSSNMQELVNNKKFLNRRAGYEWTFY
jgi:hypothetical protein